MALNTNDILDQVVSHAAASGRFERAARHEFKSAPGKGVSFETWMQRIRPIPRRSGLATTSALLLVMMRCRIPMLREPQDLIDPELSDATDALMIAFSGDFTLAGLVAEVDLLGNYGDALEAQAGYLRHDQTLYRVMDITLPLVINDAWSQSP